MDANQPKDPQGMDIWQVWNNSLAEKMNHQGIDLAAQADYLGAAAEQARGRDDRPALWAAPQASWSSTPATGGRRYRDLEGPDASSTAESGAVVDASAFVR